MHVALCFSICVVFLINLIVFSEANLIYCNDQELTWRNAMSACISAGGTPVGKDIYEASQVLMQNQSYWTADFTAKTYFTIGAVNYLMGDLCGYHEYTWGNGFGNEMFANCSFQFNYICCPEGRPSYPISIDCIQHGIREKAAMCNKTYTWAFFWSDKFNGKYWTRTAIKSNLYDIQVMQNWYYYDQNFYQCGTIKKGGTFQYTENCSWVRPSYCSFDSYAKKTPDMRVCSSPVSSPEKTQTKMQTPYMTTSSTSTENISPDKTQRTTSQSTATRNIFEETSVTTEQSISASKKTSTKKPNLDTKIPNSNDDLSVQTTDVIRPDRQFEAKIYDSKMVIGVAVGVPVVLAIFLIGLIFLRRRGIICPPRIKETDAHANAAYMVTNCDVSFSSHALSSNDNAHQHRDNETGQTDNAYSQINIQTTKIKGQHLKAPYSKEKKTFRTTRDIKRPAKRTTIQEYDNTCFKDSTKLVQGNDHDHLREGTDEYNTTCLGNIQLPNDSEYSTLGESGVYNVVDLRGNNAPNAVSTIENNGTYNTLSNQEEDYNTVNLHRDNAPHAALRSDDTYNTFRNNTDDYNVVVLNGETNPNLMIHHDDTYNTLGRGTEEYNTVHYFRNTEAKKSEDCYDHFH